jgi:protein-ribulosamine 3-kinase
LAFGFVDERGRETDDGKGSPFFITEYKNMTALTERSGAILGRRLATEVHQRTSRKGFGSEVTPYYGGATRLRNGWYNTWEQYVDTLIGDLLSALEARGGFSDLCRRGKDVRARQVSEFLSLKTWLIPRVGLFLLSFVHFGLNLCCCTADYGYVD